MSGQRIKGYVVICIDAPDSAAARKEHAAAHLAYIETVLDKIYIAGPLTEGPLSQDPSAVTEGSLFVLNVASAAEA